MEIYGDVTMEKGEQPESEKNKWRCPHGDRQTTKSENRASQQITQGLLNFAISGL